MKRPETPIGGKLRPDSDGGVLATPNPSTGRVLAAIRIANGTSLGGGRSPA